MPDSIEHLQFELSTSALAEQERRLAALRLSASTVLGAASIAGSFLGSRSNAQSDLWSIIAMVAFLLSFGVAIWILLPRALVVSVVGGERLIEEGKRVDVDEAYRAMSEWTRAMLKENAKKLERLSGLLGASCFLLALEVALWVIGAAS
jgi:hypothetical protein